MKRLAAVLFAILFLAAPLAVEAQAVGKVYRIGYLRRTAPEPAAFEAFRQGLREFDYVEGQNLVIEPRYAHGVAERLAELAAELVRLKPDVIVVDGTPTAAVAKAATTTIPIVFVLGVDPVYAAVIGLPSPTLTRVVVPVTRS
jgi:putative tryptophan/tyrosine transport system substrate-binding protein